MANFDIKIETKDYNVKTNGKNVFDQPINNDTKIYGKNRKTETGHGDYYTTSCLLDYPYFRENYKMITIDLGKQEAFNGDPRAIKKIIFTTNLDRDGNTAMFFIFE